MSIRAKRVHSYNRQNGRCIYCQWPMWERAFEPQADALRRINAVRSHKLDEIANLESFECTVEHLDRIVDGGTDAAANIVAACRDCNSSREGNNPKAWQSNRAALNQFEQAGHDKGFDAVFYSMPNLAIKKQYRFKWRYNFFVELPRWQVEVEAMKLGDFSKAGSHYRTADSIALTYPVFSSDDDFHRPEAIYASRKEIPGTHILLESVEHAGRLKAIFGNAVVKHE